MILALPLGARQCLALGILLVAITLTWRAAIWPLLDLAVTRQSDIAVLSDQLIQLRTIESQVPTYNLRERQVARQLQALDVFWSGPNQGAITASMQDLIRNATLQSGGVVVSSSSIAKDDTGSREMLGVRTRVDGTLDTLLHVLAAIDAAAPKLFVDNFSVSLVAPGSLDHPPQLSFEFSVCGYVAGGSHAN